LPLSAGKLARPPVTESIGIESHERERGTGAIAWVRITDETKHQFGVSLDPPMREQPTVLWHVTNPTAEGDGIESGRVDVVDQHPTSVGLDEPVEAAKQRCLSRSTLAYESEAAAGLYRDRNVVKCEA
jgi:hypothetical protein